ncbi:uncharacterized protein N0V89_009359 [Didymosphaeria variabile]|uniref:F-box domain-containing protein n=1 Tax=Didymosphaeria variabile TaxID=1932322 RepID=A0A9W8XDN4_9PLEO|nr:uncharacterized protein N0V89_009359 [Didymosphaeria variabile]KAJ4347987.1 hypothetical protein N0V89_009359 [Didymosphaeria variabile]
MAPSFSALPEELITSVISHVEDAGDLFNLALATKQLNRISTAHLYHRIALEVDEDRRALEFGEERSEYRSNQERLYSLVISLLGHPEHAAQVQHLHIRGLWPDPNRWRDRKKKHMGALHPLLDERIKSFKGIPITVGDNTYGWDTVEAFIVVLFHLVPNLRTLNTSLPGDSGIHWRWFFRQMPSSDCPNNLQEVALVESGGYGLARDSFLKLIRLKSLFSYNSKDFEKFQLVDPTHQDDRRYMDDAMTLISKVVNRARSREHAAEHIEILEASRSFSCLSHYIQSFAALRTFAFDFRKELVPEHRCFYNAVVLSLCVHAETLTALHLGGAYSAFHNLAPPINFSALTNLKHLRTPVLFFLGFPISSSATSLPDHLMRERFPPSLEKLVLLVYKDEEHQILSQLKHYFGTDPPIVPNLQHLDIHCHAPEAMYAWLQDPVQRRHINLRIFRKLKTNDEELFITPFVNTVEGFHQEISEVQIKITPPVSRLQLEDLMPVEEYEPDAEAIVPIFEEAIGHYMS